MSSNYPTPSFTPTLDAVESDLSSFDNFSHPPSDAGSHSATPSEHEAQTFQTSDSLESTTHGFPSLIDQDAFTNSSDISDAAFIFSQQEEEEENTVISVSTAFHPTAHPNLPEPDTIFSSLEGVLFYVHSTTILSARSTAFHDYIGGALEDAKFRNTLISFHIPSAELNIILHLLYGSSPAIHSPSFETLVNAVDHLPTFNIPPDKHILPATPLYNLLLAHSPLHPLDLYALAAHHNLEQMAVSTSAHLLSFELPNITDEHAQRMGPIYLKRLLLLHVQRFTALKNILLQPPHPHAPTKQCGFTEQRRLTRAWALVSAYLAWDARADLSSQTIQGALNPLAEHLDCELCLETLRTRIQDVVVQWTHVPHTI